MTRRRGFGHVYKKSKDSTTWYLRFPDPAKPKTSSGRSAYTVRAVGPSRKEAERVLKEIHTAVLAGTFVPPHAEDSRPDLTVANAIEQYIQSKIAEGRSERGIQRYRSSQMAMEASSVASRPVETLEPRHVEAYMAWRRGRRWGTRRRSGASRGAAPLVEVKAGERVSNSSVNRDLALLSAAVQRLVRMRQLAENPVRLVRRGRGTQRPPGDPRSRLDRHRRPLRADGERPRRGEHGSRRLRPERGGCAYPWRTPRGFAAVREEARCAEPECVSRSPASGCGILSRSRGRSSIG